MKKKLSINKIFQSIRSKIIYSLLLIFILLGGWCVPPKWFEKIVEGIKAKYTTEFVLEEENNLEDLLKS